jgi:chemotaxis protein methyltransferase CheR
MWDAFDREVDLSEEEFRLLRDFLHETFGLYFDDNSRSLLRSRLLGRLSSLDLRSFEDYYHYLRFGPHRAHELESMVSHLTNNETYFFREATQLGVFADSVLRTIRERKAAGAERRLRVLSAGCSTGEEPLSLAMILLDSGQFFWNWDLQVVGMDIDAAALEKARRGLYFRNSFRSVEEALITRHFTPEGTGQRVKENVRRLVTLRQGNLIERASYTGLTQLDVLFCRNVLIYFSDDSIRRSVQLFFDCLAPGGYLFLGHAESLSRITDIFTPIRFQGALIYQKPLEVTQ